MAASWSRSRAVAVFFAVAATGVALVECSPSVPTTPPSPSVEPTATSSTTGSAPPVEYTGPILEPKNDVPARLHTPAVGSAERTAILDGLRLPVEADLKQQVVFKVMVIQAQGEWAYVRATPLTPGGSRIDYRKTKYREAVESGAFDDAVDALVKNSDGSWQAVAYVIGATDVAWSPWAGQFGAPEAIFVTQ